MAGVSTTHPEYDKFAPVWQRCDDVVAGQRVIHAAGQRYLPMLKDESLDEYRARIARSDFFNATWRTISGLVGMAFRKEPRVSVPAAIEPYLDDIDLAGTTAYSLAKGLVEDVLEYGRLGLLVDHPAMPEGVTTITKAVAERLGLRPSVKVYSPHSIINWKVGRVGNSSVLVQVVLRETALIDNDEFERVEEVRYRVLDLDPAGNYRQRLFRKNDRGEDEQLGGDIYPMMNGAPLDRIPFQIIGANGFEVECDEPPLIDLVDKNVAHYQINADYRHGLHFTGLPTLFLAGVHMNEGEKFYIGSQAAITSPDPNAKGMFIEFGGQGLGAIEKALARLEMQMALLGARMIADETAQAETLGATQIKRAGENSVLSSIVLSCSRAMEWALGLVAQWSGAQGEVVYQINRDFLPALMTAQELTALIGAVQAGELSSRELFDLLQRGDLIDGQKTYEEHQEEVESVPTLPRPDMGGIAA